MYAVIDTGGRQLRVQAGEVVHVDRLSGEAGDAVRFDRVLLVGDEGGLRVGQPVLDGVAVRGTVVRQLRGPKIPIYTYKKTQNSNRRRLGHRQDLTAVRIESIDG
jgi:large subunit ribosomal protein L21